MSENFEMNLLKDWGWLPFLIPSMEASVARVETNPGEKTLHPLGLFTSPATSYFNLSGT